MAGDLAAAGNDFCPGSCKPLGAAIREVAFVGHSNQTSPDLVMPASLFGLHNARRIFRMETQLMQETIP